MKTKKCKMQACRKKTERKTSAIKTNATIKAEEVGESKNISLFLYFANGSCQGRVAKPVMTTNTMMSWPDRDGRCSGWQPTHGSREKKMCNLYTKFFLIVTRKCLNVICVVYVSRGDPLGCSVRAIVSDARSNRGRSTGTASSTLPSRTVPRIAWQLRRAREELVCSVGRGLPMAPSYLLPAPLRPLLPTESFRETTALASALGPGAWGRHPRPARSTRFSDDPSV